MLPGSSDVSWSSADISPVSASFSATCPVAGSSEFVLSDKSPTISDFSAFSATEFRSVIFGNTCIRDEFSSFGCSAEKSDQRVHSGVDQEYSPCASPLETSTPSSDVMAVVSKGG